MVTTLYCVFESGEKSRSSKFSSKGAKPAPGEVHGRQLHCGDPSAAQPAGHRGPERAGPSRTGVPVNACAVSGPQRGVCGQRLTACAGPRRLHRDWSTRGFWSLRRVLKPARHGYRGQLKLSFCKSKVTRRFPISQGSAPRTPPLIAG